MIHRTPLLLFESDLGRRQAERQARGIGSTESHIRHAVSRLRKGDKPHEVGLNLFRDSPEAHAQYVSNEGNPHRAVMAAAPHVHAYDEADRTHAAHSETRPANYVSGSHSQEIRNYNSKEGDLRAAKFAALNRLKEAAKNLGVKAGHLLAPRDEEGMKNHMDRIGKIFNQSGRPSHGFAPTSHPEEYLGRFTNQKHAEEAAAAAQHWSKTHDVKLTGFSKDKTKDDRSSQHSRFVRVTPR